MGRLREIPRTAAFAWSAGSPKPALATGTRAGAIDADFTSENKLDIWDLDLDNHNTSVDLKPVASLDTDSRCAIDDLRLRGRSFAELGEQVLRHCME